MNAYDRAWAALQEAERAVDEALKVTFPKDTCATYRSWRGYPVTVVIVDHYSGQRVRVRNPHNGKSYILHAGRLTSS